MEKEIDLVHKMNRELGEINTKIAGLGDKITENHEVHIENAQKIEQILVQTTKTNGKVINCESFIEAQYKINSKLDGLYSAMWEKIEKDKVAWEGKYVTVERYTNIEKIVYAALAMILTAVLGGLLKLIIK